MGKKILLADDSITIQKVIELTFSDEDFEVVTVGNGRLAIEKVQEVRPDVVLCDIIMTPETDGYDVCDFIKKQPTLANIPVLLLTGAFEPFDQDRAARVGCDGFLAKPFEPQTLIAKVKDLLSQVAARPPLPVAPAPTPAPTFAAPPAATLSAPSAPSLSALAPPPGEPSMTYIPEEPEMEEAPLGFADVMDTAPPEPAGGLDLSALDPGTFATMPDVQPSEQEELLDVSPEEQTSLQPPPRVSDSGATVMFQAANPPVWSPPPVQAPPPEPAPAAAAPERAMFEEVFEEDLAPSPVEEPASLRPFAAAGPAASPLPLEPPIENVASLGATESDEQNSFADLGPPVARVEEPPSEAADVAVPVDQVAQIAQRVVGQISEKVIREIAWEVIPDLAEALIRKEIERLKSELQ